MNDMLCQIETACRYAERSNRLVVIDTAYKNSAHFRDNFAKYFSSRWNRVLVDSDLFLTDIDAMSVFPQELTGRVTSYRPEWSAAAANWVDAETGIRLSFDFDRTYDEQIVLHHAQNGGPTGVGAMARLKLNRQLIDALAERLRAIGGPYSAIHIRNTDYKTDYIDALKSMKHLLQSPVFIATDDAQCRETCAELLGPTNVIYFSDISNNSGMPLHFIQDAETVFDRNTDAILDLLTLALSSRFFKFRLQNNIYHSVFSGFTILVDHLRHYKIVLSSLIDSSSEKNRIFSSALEGIEN
ncbi:MAG: hypothetical protein INR71_03745 [Terriglobus roseus]|nr:hypothetical protein [Terriglobus roseus]